MKTTTLLFSLFVFATQGFAREWSNTAGKKIQADFVEVKGAGGAEVVVLKMAGGKAYHVPLNQLSDADQTFAREQAKTAAASPPATTAASTTGAPDSKPSIFKEMLKGKLVALEGKRVGKYEMAEEPKFYAFYFSASWCGPCKAFTPKLVEFYKAHEGKKKDFEVIFVSRDNDEPSMEEYIKEDAMPWPAISFRNVAKMEKIDAYCGRGIPCLVLVDREGNVLSDSYEGQQYVGPSKVMSDIEEKTAK